MTVVLRGKINRCDVYEGMMDEAVVAVGYPQHDDYGELNEEEIRGLLLADGKTKAQARLEAKSIALFVHEMGIGKRILLQNPKKPDTFQVVKITGGYVCKEDGEYPLLKHQRKMVVENMTIERKYLPPSIQKQLKSPSPCIQLPQHIEALLQKELTHEEKQKLLTKRQLEAFLKELYQRGKFEEVTDLFTLYLDKFAE